MGRSVIAGRAGAFAMALFAAASSLAAPDQRPDALNARVIELFNAGRYSEALPLARAYAEATKTRLGDKHPEYASALNNWARLYQALGRHAEAEPLLRRVLAIDEQSLGPDHPDTASDLNNLAALLLATNRLAEAEPLLRRALAADEKTEGADHPNVASRLNNLAELLRGLDRFAEAEPLLRRALAIDEKTFGPSHPKTALRLNNLAALIHETGRLDEAEPLMRKALEIDEKAYGLSHPNVASDAGNLASLLYEANRFDEAEPLMRRALAIDEQALGRNHPTVALRLSNLSALLHAANHWAEAEQLIRRALAIDEGGEGAERSKTASNLNNLAALLKDMNRLDEAEPLLRRALSINEDVHGPDHEKVAANLDNLANILLAAERRAEAEPLFRRALAIHERNLGPNHPKVAIALNNLSELLQDVNRRAEAEPLLRRALAIDEKAYGPSHPTVATDLGNLSELLREAGKAREAEPLLRRALAIHERGLGPEHPDTARDLNNLAWLYAGQSDWRRSLEFMRRAAMISVANARRLRGRSGEGEKRLLLDNSRKFKGFVQIAFRAAPSDPVVSGEAFTMAQRASLSDAASALAQASARFAAGSDSLAALLRERQDLLRDRDAVDRKLLAALGAGGDGDTKRNCPLCSANTDALRRSLADLETRLDAVAARLAKEFPGYAALMHPEPLTIDAAQALLEPDEALVAFLDVEEIGRTPAKGFVWAISKTKVRWVETPLSGQALRREVQALRCGLDGAMWNGDGAQRCSEALGRRAQASGLSFPFDLNRAHRLYQGLFGKIEDVISGKRRLVATSGALTQLPLQTLVTAPPGDGADYRSAAWLIRDHALTLLPAVSSLEALRRTARPNGATKPLIGFGNPLLSGDEADPAEKKLARLAKDSQSCREASLQKETQRRGRQAGIAPLETRGGLADVVHIRSLPPLPETADELCAVARELKADPGDIRLGARASESEVKRLSAKGSLAQYRVVHFATHDALAGQVRGAAEPGLILTPPKEASADDDGYLSASEIAMLKLNADWVILSACNTAAGNASGGEALSGLARAFIYAQARALLVSHWEVDSNATVKLVTSAVGAMVQDSRIGRAEAMRRAMLALIDKGEPREAHPAYWAPFVVVGEGR